MVKEMAPYGTYDYSAEAYILLFKMFYGSEKEMFLNHAFSCASLVFLADTLGCF